MKQMTHLALSQLAAPLPTVTAHLRGSLPEAHQGPSPTSPGVERPGIDAALLDDLCEESPGDCTFWDALRQPQARVVVTGQQPGALGGSLLVFYKAATAVALARRWQQERGTPVVPVFWNATDDVDFDEIATVGWQTPEAGLFYAQLPPEDRRPEAFIGDLPARGDVEALAAIGARLPESARAALDAVVPADAVDHGQWVSQLLRRVFPDLLVLDARSAALRRHAAPLFQRYLEQLPQARQSIEQQIAALESLGHRRVLAPGSIAMGLFLTADRHRQKTDDAALLSRHLADDPTSLSPNVTLRPLVQDLLLPTIASVVGPSELGYHLELQPLRALLSVPQPMLVSRLSGTALPSPVWEALQDNGVAAEDWLRQPQEALQKAARRNADADLQQAGSLWEQFESELPRRAPRAADEAALRRVHKGLKPVRERLQRDIVEAHTRELLERAPVLEKAVQIVQPGGRMQERVLCGLWLVAQQGADTGEQLVQAAMRHLQQVENGEDAHAVWVLEGQPQTATASPRGES